MSWSVSEIFKLFKILATLYYQVKNSRRSREFLNPIICHSCSFFKEYKNNQVSNEQYIPNHLLIASITLQKITCKKVISVIDSWGAFHYGKISETFRVKWKDFPVISLRTADVSPRSSPLREVLRVGTSATQRQKFHTDDAKSVQNPVRSANWSTE